MAPAHAPISAQGGALGALSTGIARPDPSLGAGAPARVNRRGHRAWLPGSCRRPRIPILGTHRTAVFRRRR
ncbi:hypothetical protein T484DRAFT_2135413 [Baffinella frigidus]|jgi:hypothetical protein|nr:hypothetical protein T484DRAFT_2135413 [Cryptophyta sp. CCMP2293]